MSGLSCRSMSLALCRAAWKARPCTIPAWCTSTAWCASAEHPQTVRGIKCHWESGGLSHWGPTVLEKAAEAGRDANLPLYVHTGELFPVDEANRPKPSAVMGQVVQYLKPGDVLAHVYSRMPDGIMSTAEDVPGWLFEAKAAGVLFDLGHGVNLSFRIARKMMEKGIFP